MKFLVDVNIPQSVIDHLVSSGFDVLDLKKSNLKATDLDVIKLAQVDGRIILTLDKDFISLTQFPKYQVPTIVIRLKSQLPGRMIAFLDELLKNQEESILNRSLTIIREGSADSHKF